MGIGAWERVAEDRLVIATPHTGLVNFEWATSFKVLHSPIPFNLISNRGLPIDRAREELVMQARNIGATHLFFLDSDVMVPPDGLLRLYHHNLPIVGAIYGAKHGCPGAWVQQAQTGNGRYGAVMAEFLEKHPLFCHPEVVIGMGACLIQLEVFNRIPQPWFVWTHGRDPNGGVSEDFYFCENIRQHVPIWIDTSVRCQHIDIATSLDWKGTRDRVVLP